MSLFNQLIQYIAPCTRLGSIAAKIGTIAYTGYSVSQIHAKEDGDESTLFQRLTLSGLYILHMGAMTLTTAVMLGQIEFSPAIATACVGLTSLLKGFAELHNERIAAENLTLRKQALETQLKQRNFDFERMLIIIEDLKDAENEIVRQDEKINALIETLNQIKDIKHNGKSDSLTRLKTQYTQLKKQANEQFKKVEAVNTYFGDSRNQRMTLEQSIRQLSENAELNRDNVDILNDIGIIQQQSIKLKKTKETIQKCDGQINIQANLTPEERTYLIYLRDALQLKADSLTQMSHQHFHVQLNEMSFEFLTIDEMFKLKPWICRNILEEIHYLKQQTILHLEGFIDKKERFQKMSGKFNADLPSNFSMMYQNLKKTVDIHNQLSMTVLREISQKSTISFSTVTATIALLLCVVPNAQYAQLLQPAMLGVGFSAGASSIWNFHRKYLLKQKLSQAETRRLKALIHDNGHHVFANVHDTYLRQHLIESLNVTLDSNCHAKGSETFNQRHTRIAKVKAKLLMYHQAIKKHKPKKTEPVVTVATKRATKHNK